MRSRRLLVGLFVCALAASNAVSITPIWKFEEEYYDPLSDLEDFDKKQSNKLTLEETDLEEDESNNDRAEDKPDAHLSSTEHGRSPQQQNDSQQNGSSHQRGSSAHHNSSSQHAHRTPKPTIASGGGCSPGQKGRTKCGEYCVCKENKKWQCCRVRFEVNNLIHRPGGMKILERYTLTYKKMAKHDLTVEHYRAIIDAHHRLFSAGIHNLLEFSAWHRWYLLQMENLMRRHDCRVTIPYVDWGKISETWRTSKLFSPNVMGTDGNPSHHNCVMDGPFKAPGWTTTPQKDLDVCNDTVPRQYRCCLQRHFKKNNFHSVVYSEGNLKQPPPEYEGFLCLTVMDIYVLGHDLLGGTMGTVYAAEAPMFNLHTAYIDYLWWRYTRSSPEHRATALKFHRQHPTPLPGTDWRTWPNITGTKPGGIKPEELVDSTRLGLKKNICVTYEWDHSHLEKKLSAEEVRNLSSSQQWAYLEDKLSRENITEIPQTAREKEPSWTALQAGWQLFKPPKRCIEVIKLLQGKILGNIHEVNATVVKKDKEAKRTGVPIDELLAIRDGKK